MTLESARPKNERHRGGQLRPHRLFALKLLPAGSGELVVLRSTIVVRRSPTGLHPTAALEAMQRWIERALRNLKRFTRDLLNALGDRPAVLRAERKCLQDQQVERALWQVDACVGHVSFPVRPCTGR